MASTSIGPRRKRVRNVDAMPRPTLVEELDHRRVGADCDDQLGAFARREQHRDVLARAVGDELLILDAPRRQRLAPGARDRPGARGAPARRRSAAPLGHRVEVADDDVGREPDPPAARRRRRRRRSTPACTRACTAGARRGRSGSRAPRTTTNAWRPWHCVRNGGSVRGSKNSRASSVDVLERVRGEQLELAPRSWARRLHRSLSSSSVEHVADRDELVVAPDLAVGEADDVAVADHIEEIGAIDVDEGDARLHDPQGPMFGYRPVVDARVQDRDHARPSTRPSAATRSRFSCLMTAISPGSMRFRTVLRSPVDPGRCPGPASWSSRSALTEPPSHGRFRAASRPGRAPPCISISAVLDGVRACRAARSPSSSRRACVGRVADPASIRRQLRRPRSSPSTTVAVPRCAPAVLDSSTAFSTTTCVSGERRHLGQVGDDEHLVPVAQRRERPSRPRPPASPPIPASTSSNTSVGGAAVSTTRSASIARASSPPDATLASGAAPLAGVGGEQERDPVVAVVGRRRRLDRRPRPPAGMASSRRCASTAAEGSRRRRGARRRQCGRGRGGVRSCAVGALSRRARPPARSCASSSASRRRRLVGGTRSPRRACRRTCGAARGAAGGGRGRVVEPRRDRRRCAPPIARSSLREVGAARPQRARSRSASVRERARGRRARRSRRRASSSPAPADHLVDARWRLAVRRRRRPAGPPRRSSASSSSASPSAGRVELVDLEAQQVDLAGAGPCVAAERGERRRRCRAPRRALARYAVERSSAAHPRNGRGQPRCTAGSRSRLWWACWPCRSTSARPARRARRRSPAARRRRPGSRPSRGHDPASTISSPVSASHEATLDARLVGAGAHEAGVGPAADQQLDGLDQQRLAGAGLARERGQARAEHQGQLARSTPRFATCSSTSIRALPIGQAELGLQDLVEVAWPEA